MATSVLLPVPLLAWHGARPVFLRGRELVEGQPWAHICWILPGEPITAAPSVIEERLPDSDLVELDGQDYDFLPRRPGALLALPPLVAYAGQVVLLRGWRQAASNGGSWWAHLARLNLGERDGRRRAALVDLQVAAAEITPLPGQDYARVPRVRDGQQ
ncbi:hypothetical protein ACFFMN_05240 [Planobispora siamensis]|uniref:Uncharacterized protein n=1 Tax=Planobispora siamensis TaxID=936338 RepID=A0A8J3SYQ5_9ACTN|nr:hypothetical protein [Planobispora siamensis]GIH97933.1 hypothetical protein Psi01_85630 [Planobispora siamensis]